MKFNLRNRVLLPTLALVAAVTLTSNLVSYFMASRSLHSAVEKDMENICTSSLRLIENWIGGQRNNLAVLASQRLMVQALQTGAEGASAQAELNADLARMKSIYGFYEDIHLIDGKGLTHASSNPSVIGKVNVSDRAYFQEAIKGRNALSEVIASRTAGHPVVVLATPVKAKDITCGVLLGVVDLTWFSSRFITDIKVLQTGYVFVFDEKGVWMAHPQKELVLKTRLADFDWAKPILQQENGRIYYTFEGVEKTAVFARSKELKWGVVATAPQREGNAAARQMGWINLSLGTVALAIAALLGSWIARGIARPVAFVADQLKAGAEQTASAASQVSASSQSLAEGASESAASLEETSASLEEMASMTKRNAEGANTAKTLANQARAAAEQGSQSTLAMNQTVNSIQTSSEEMRSAMNAVKSSNDEVSKIIKTIDDIAFQTNILALNAAVEAARAGEAGMGFAVVADEVRNLAQKCAQAARETTQKIEAAVARSEQGVRASEKVNEQLKSVVLQARDVEEKLSGIFQKAQQVDSLVAEIAGASQEQSQGIDQVNKAMCEMDKVTQSNAANAEESASAAEELNAQAEIMKVAVNGLLRLVNGTTLESEPMSSRATSPRNNGTKSFHAELPSPVRSINGNGAQVSKNAFNTPAHQPQPELTTANRPTETPLEGEFKEF